MNEEECRAMILHLLRRGVTPTAIKRQTGASYSTIQRVRQRQSATRSPVEFGSKRMARTPEVVDQLVQILDENPRQSMRQLAKDLEISPTSVRRAVKEDLGKHSYARPRRHIITPGARKRRKERCGKLINRLKHNDAKLSIIHSDEKWFTLAAYSNRRNDQFIWDKGDQKNAPDELRHVGVRQHAAGAMFLGIVGSNGKKGPPIWVPQGMKVNADSYHDTKSSRG